MDGREVGRPAEICRRRGAAKITGLGGASEKILLYIINMSSVETKMDDVVKKVENAAEDAKKATEEVKVGGRKLKKLKDDVIKKMKQLKKLRGGKKSYKKARGGARRRKTRRSRR